MTPEEQSLLRRVVKLSEDNNRMLKGVRRHMCWSVAWGFCKFLLIAIPLVVGYIYVKDNLQPSGWIEHTKEMIDSIR